MSLEYKCRRFEKGWEDEGLPPAPAYGWQQKDGARRTGPSVPLAGIQLSMSRIGLFGWISEQAFRGVLVYGRPGGSVEAGGGHGLSGVVATLAIAPRWGSKGGWGRSQPSPLGWASAPASAHV